MGFYYAFEVLDYVSFAVAVVAIYSLEPIWTWLRLYRMR